MARKFTKILFQGNESALENIARLEARLQEGLMISGGLQQPDRPDSEAVYQRALKHREELERELRDIVKDIGAALTGEDWFSDPAAGGICK